MKQPPLTLTTHHDTLEVEFRGELCVYTISKYEKELEYLVSQKKYKQVVFNLESLSYLDTAAALFLEKQAEIFHATFVTDTKMEATLNLARKHLKKNTTLPQQKSYAFVERIGRKTYEYYEGALSFFSFLGMLFNTKLLLLKNIQNIRFKEIAFEINESAIKAIGIIALTSFLIGLVVAYQSAYQLKIYGANIFIVDMLGLSILRELAPLITAIVIAGRSGSAFTAQIGAMKITQELDAMRTMGFDPYIFLVMPRIIALMIAMPLLIFLADIMGLFGGIIVANIDLKITTDLFIDRFNEVIAAKHFIVGIIKGPFFAFLIATIGIYRGLRVKDDTQSIGFNTTKSVVESIFAVIVCDAIFSIAFTNLGI